jgi:beta-mannosidase
MNTVTLNGLWHVYPEELDCKGATGYAVVRAITSGWLPARVPGEIHLDLIRAGQMKEPSVGNQAPDCRWPETKSWWYRTSFEVDESFLEHERQELVFDGLDLYAQVFVNGHLAGEAQNAFIPALFDVKHLLKTGVNELVVRLTAGSELAADATPPGQGQANQPNLAAHGAIPNPARGENDLYGNRMWAGKKWLRKPQFTYGWDWVDALPNIGIWRGVHLEGRRIAVIDELRLDALTHGSEWMLEMDAVVENLHPWSERRCELTLDIQPPDGGPLISRRYELDVPPGRTPVRDYVPVPNPQLWWPNGMGSQPLYDVIARVSDGAGIVCDERRFRMGLRTIAIDRSRLKEGHRFCIRVNGQEVFCRGGNIGPHDMIPARITDAKSEALVAEAKQANMNMLRINGCSTFESSAFYDACDRLGILVWHDFMLTCTTYPEQNAAFTAGIHVETEAIVKLLRHHASIALWCGNNECTWGFRDWWNPDKTKPLDLGGQAFYNQLIPDLCRRLDPRRPYWPSSPAGGEDPNGELSGDCHWWGPFFMNGEMNRRIHHQTFDECRARFVSEYGVIGPCHLDSMREYLAPDDMRPDSIAWRVHTNSFEKDTVPAAIRRHYADPETLSVADYVLYGQLFQAMIHGHAMEALRFRKQDPADDCQGALIWSYSDCWGETGWSILDYYLRRKASYYWFRRACAPVKVIVRQRADMLVTRVVNDTLAAFSGTVEVGWWRLDGSAREVKAHRVTVAANSMLEVAAGPVMAPVAHDPHAWLYAAVLRGEDAVAFDQSVWTLAPHRELVVPPPDIRVKARAEGEFEIRSEAYCHAVHVEDHGRALLSDNWFDLLPGVPVCVRRVAETPATELRFEAVTPGSGNCKEDA